MKKQMNLAEGNVEKLVMRMAVPMVVAQLVSMLYNIVDRIFVGRIPEIGAVALGGIGIYLPINILLNSSLRKYGAEALTGYGVDGATLAISVGTIVTATSSFIRQPINGFCQGVQPVISYNYGAGRQERVHRAIRFSILVTTIYAAAFWLFMLVSPETFAKMFTDSRDVAAVSGNLIRFYVFGMIFAGVQSTLIQAFGGRGMKKYSLFVSLFSKGLYVPLLLIFPIMVPPSFRLLAVYAAQMVTDIAGVIFIVGLYVKSNKQGL